jgi:dipeptide/tripeptide permease
MFQNVFKIGGLVSHAWLIHSDGCNVGEIRISYCLIFIGNGSVKPNLIYLGCKQFDSLI